jgi:uncharacterized protein (TIGR02598 family)
VKRRRRTTASFSLVEVALALGITGFCLIAIIGLLPIGEQTNRNATSQTAAISIIGAVIADLRATPNVSTTSDRYQINIGTAQIFYVDGAGRFADMPTSTSRYRVNITYPPNGGLSKAATYLALQVTWPANATPANAAGSAEVFAAIDRH